MTVTASFVTFAESNAKALSTSVPSIKSCCCALREFPRHLRTEVSRLRRSSAVPTSCKSRHSPIQIFSLSATTGACHAPVLYLQEEITIESSAKFPLYPDILVWLFPVLLRCLLSCIGYRFAFLPLRPAYPSILFLFFLFRPLFQANDILQVLVHYKINN